MNTLAQLKKSTKSGLDKLKEQLTKITTNQSPITPDERLWYPATDKAGNGFAIIRFLPESKGEEVPFVRKYNHAFQQDALGETGPWFIENCPTTLGNGHPCPVCEHNKVLWEKGDKTSKAIVGKQKRQLSFYSNVLIIEDPATPDNKGKVFIFRYGKQIFDKLKTAMEPLPNSGDEPLNPFDPWEGANFRVLIANKEKRRNYDNSKFDKPSVLGTDKEIEAIWDKQYPLMPFIDPKEFKSYDLLKDRLVKVLGGSVVPTSPPPSSNKPSIVDHKLDNPFVNDEEDDEDAAIQARLQQLVDED